MQRWIVTSALALAAAALAVSIVRTPPQEAQATQVRPSDAAVPEPLLVVEPAPDHQGMFSRAALDRGAHKLGSSQERFLVVEVQAPEQGAVERQPLHLAVVVDRSGSMEGESIQNAIRATSRLVNRLGPQDSFALVGFSGEAATLASRQPVRNRERLGGLAEGLDAGGYTNLYAGLEQGIMQLWDTPAGNRRVLLLSDGLTNRGVTDPDAIAGLAASAARQGITVSALGLGVEFDGDLLHAISDAAGGHYLYAGRSAELVDSFEAELDRAFAVAARDTRVEVALADGTEVLEVYGYETWDGKATEDGFEAFLGDMSAGETRKVVVRARVPAEREATMELAEVTVSWEDPSSGRRSEHEHQLRLQVTDDQAQVRASRVPWATVLASTAVVGRHMQWANEAWGRGDGDEAKQVLRRGRQRLGQLTRNIDDPRVASMDQELISQQERYASVSRESWAGRDLEKLESLRALGYLD
jgi:Ca-activated chloride channel homolog